MKLRKRRKKGGLRWYRAELRHIQEVADEALECNQSGPVWDCAERQRIALVTISRRARLTTPTFAMKPYYSESGIEIYCGDCREVLPSLAGVSVDLVLTDPPYGTGWVRGGGAVGIFKPRLERADWDVFDLGWLSGVDAAAFALFTPNSRLDETRAAFGETSTFWYVKSNPRPMGPDREPIVVYPKREDDEFVAYNGDAGEHPCQKPDTLMRWLVSRFDASTILDPFMGSGTTLRAAKDLGRRAIGIEIEERYCEIAANRLRQSVMQFGTTPTLGTK